MQNIYPVLRYRDPEAGIAWLRQVLGFTEHAVHRDESGAVVHAELAWQGDLVMLGAAREDSTPTQLYLAVADADAAHQRAVESGAKVTSPPTDTDYGSRDLALEDPDGNTWFLGTYRPSEPAR
ncbi:putative conserved protein PhnB, glyoxalase superfamily [Streptoalloteichus tenebrarius]|uniref:Conserved protein PhnB, glyoxalase superfamily n=1 Tax=Streptoalloteichus tenebrarius (strain ATCC 17920 / DSM 40477 / JCM 4838 / CBS 697.72 / NBRC 16177 / NCIMB 11028 / NRRL B-12390 / A12253. 1 / ISP 5477) TaxID=1933 RepID=A0ABT1I304_STRSD|nr:VOC family protein [Streptoalloteichus tenebrarius]MCP2262169.1 putative conserved protein PhnB, glyoxalase superfamily [Streptoalloteichus tenebrarius]BFF00028.1 VOC family protein [Streptoalloteichus tenebrarius]